MGEKYSGAHRKVYSRREALVGIGSVTAGLALITGFGLGPPLKRFLDQLNEDTFSLPEDILKARTLEEKSGASISNPLARFNMSLKGGNTRLNPDSCFGATEQPFTTPTSEKLREELNELREFVDDEGDQMLTGYKLNWDKFIVEGEDPILFLASYHNELSGGATKYRLEELARQTERAIFAINVPAEDGSDKYTTKQLESFENGEGFAEVSRTMLRIMQKEGIVRFDGTAQSGGARLLASVAKYAYEVDIKVGKLHLVEPPVRKFTLGQLRDRFLSEAQYLDLAQSFPYDPKMREASGFAEHPLMRFLKSAVWVGKGITRDPNFYVAEELTKGTLQHDLEVANVANLDMSAKLVSGSLSSICTHPDALAMVSDMRSKGLPIFFASYPGEHHTVLENAVRYAADARIFLNQ